MPQTCHSAAYLCADVQSTLATNQVSPHCQVIPGKRKQWAPWHPEQGKILAKETHKETKTQPPTPPIDLDHCSGIFILLQWTAASLCTFLSPDCCRRVENLIPMPRAFLLPTYWADDPVSGIQAIEHGIETFLIEAQAPLILLNNQLLCNNTAQQNSSGLAHATWAG